MFNTHPVLLNLNWNTEVCSGGDILDTQSYSDRALLTIKRILFVITNLLLVTVETTIVLILRPLAGLSLILVFNLGARNEPLVF